MAYPGLPFFGGLFYEVGMETSKSLIITKIFVNWTFKVSILIEIVKGHLTFTYWPWKILPRNWKTGELRKRERKSTTRKELRGWAFATLRMRHINWIWQKLLTALKQSHSLFDYFLSPLMSWWLCRRNWFKASLDTAWGAAQLVKATLVVHHFTGNLAWSRNWKIPSPDPVSVNIGSANRCDKLLDYYNQCYIVALIRYQRNRVLMNVENINTMSYLVLNGTILIWIVEFLTCNDS